jgi:thiol-disulfide isomerase/thioredoxin
MRKLLVTLALAGLFAVTVMAQDKAPAAKDPTKKAGGKLAVGDPAPALKASKWLQGDEVKSFEPGKVYVVEFWATWCGPCIVMMPHMGDLQAEYKDKGVTIVGFSSKDQNNDEKKVTDFVKARGKKLGYTFAYEDNRDTNNAWMTASGQGGIPCSFVVDKTSKIAYIGHPMYLDVVLPKVVDGTWKGKESLEEMKTVEKDVNGVFGALRGKDTEATLEALKNFEKKHPALSNIPYFTGPKLGLLLKAKKTDELKKMAETIITKADKRGDTSALQTVAMTLSSPDANGNKELLGIAVKAAEASVKLAGEKDAIALYYLANTYFNAGEKAKARETGKKAVEAATDPRLKQAIEQRVKKFEE